MTQRRKDSMGREPGLHTGVPVRDDPAHWDTLAARIAGAAVRDARRGEIERFVSSRAGLLAAAVLLVAALAWFAAPTTGVAADPPDLAGVIAPADDMGRSLVSREGPPAIGALVLADTRGGRR